MTFAPFSPAALAALAISTTESRTSAERWSCRGVCSTALTIYGQKKSRLETLESRLLPNSHGHFHRHSLIQRLLGTLLLWYPRFRSGWQQACVCIFEVVPGKWNRRSQDKLASWPSPTTFAIWHVVLPCIQSRQVHRVSGVPHHWIWCSPLRECTKHRMKMARWLGCTQAAVSLASWQSSRWPWERLRSRSTSPWPAWGFLRRAKVELWDCFHAIVLHGPVGNSTEICWNLNSSTVLLGRWDHSGMHIPLQRASTEVHQLRFYHRCNLVCDHWNMKTCLDSIGSWLARCTHGAWCSLTFWWPCWYQGWRWFAWLQKLACSRN